jgi:hypothetical protein
MLIETELANNSTGANRGNREGNRKKLCSLRSLMLTVSGWSPRRCDPTSAFTLAFLVPLRFNQTLLQPLAFFAVRYGILAFERVIEADWPRVQSQPGWHWASVRPARESVNNALAHWLMVEG